MVTHTSLPPPLPPSPKYEDAQESPLEQCISESMTNQKDNGLFSFVPKGVPVRAEGGPQPLPESRPLSNPDSFQDFFRLLGRGQHCRVWGWRWGWEVWVWGQHHPIWLVRVWAGTTRFGLSEGLSCVYM